MYLELSLQNDLKTSDSICFLFWATKNYFANGAKVRERYYNS